MNDINKPISNFNIKIKLGYSQKETLIHVLHLKEDY